MDFEQIDLNQELLLRIGRENDKHVISWDILKSVGDTLEALVQTVAKHSAGIESGFNIDNFKLDFSGFYNGSPVPAFRLNTNSSFSFFNDNEIKQGVITAFSKIISLIDKGNYQEIADGYDLPVVKNEIVRRIYDFTNSAGEIPVTIVKREDQRFKDVYSIRKLKKTTFEKLIVHEYENRILDNEESTAVAKMVIATNKSGKTSKRTTEIYNDKEATLSLKLPGFSFLNKIFEFKNPILFQIYSEGRGTIIENEQLDLYASGKTITDAKIDLYSQFDHSYQRLNELTDDQLSTKLLQVKQYFNFIIKTVKEI